MEVLIREYRADDLAAMISIWNEIVEEGIAFPQDHPLDLDGAARFFQSQSFTGVAEFGGQIAGLYILHPNNVGRCAHLANASFAVSSLLRGKKVGESLVLHSLCKGKELGFRVLQFNAVVKTNTAAIHLYEKLGFTRLGTIPGGFRMKNGSFEDIIPFYIEL
ncbi:MAG: GNAT family N-acetyltransferase [Planctomycetia bacterium]|nr:GNAT family N-acetyltransferase [Planctomycetia bacterium]